MHVVHWPGGIVEGRLKTIRERPVAVVVSLRADGKTIPRSVHRLVLEAFVGPCPDGMEGCHNDGNPQNNAVSNLRWDNHSSNVSDMEKHGTKKNPPLHYGESHPNAKLSEHDIAEIRASERKRGMRATLARKFGVSATSISRIWSNVQRAANGPNKADG